MIVAVTSPDVSYAVNAASFGFSALLLPGIPAGQMEERGERPPARATCRS